MRWQSALMILILLGCDDMSVGDGGLSDGGLRDGGLSDGGFGDAAAGDASTEADGAVSTDAAIADGGTPLSPRCFDGPIEVTNVGGVQTARSPRYEVEAQSDAMRAERFARMLEASWLEYADYFGAEVDTAGTRLKVRFFRDRAAFLVGLAEDGVADPGGAGGYYEPSNRTAYLFDQPTLYFTRSLLLHEAAHQYHDLTRTVGDLPFWYAEGVAEYLSRHDWDGRCIRLGILPLLTQEDSPAEALSMLESGGVEIGAIVDESASASRPLAWALFRYFEHAGDGALEPAFRAFRMGVDQGMPIPTRFRAELGDAAGHDTPWLAFIRGEQEPLTPAFLEWTHIGPTSLSGQSEFFTIAPIKELVSRFETSFAVPSSAGWSAGVILGFESPSRFEALVVRDTGRVQRFDVDGSAFWNDVGPAPSADGGRYRLEVTYTPGRVSVTINTMVYEFDTSLPARSGPALDAAEVRFDELSWR